MILIANPVSSTIIVTIILIACIVISSRPKKYTALFPPQLSNELKGFAILAIVFSHIGYLLASTDRFLWPLSILAGVGVNLFLFLSGYGLTMSAIHKPPTLISSTKRLLKLFIPLWIVLAIYFTLAYFVHGTTFSAEYIAKSFAGIFLRADANQDINSVLWYFTIVLFYYILFPILFIRKYIWLSALALIAISTIIVFRDPVILHDVMRLYQVHILAFPLGMLVAWVFTLKRVQLGVPRIIKIVHQAYLERTEIQARRSLYVVAVLLLSVLIGFSAVHSFVDEQPLLEQLSSLLTMFLIIALFIVKRFEVGLFALFGYVSFEVYLLHWPLLNRYDVLYSHLPAWLATILYFALFLLLGSLLHALVGKINNLIGNYQKNSNR
jgi:peptidoglycan/LPS O-acetylase OafA/YrhL